MKFKLHNDRRSAKRHLERDQSKQNDAFLFFSLWHHAGSRNGID